MTWQDAKYTLAYLGPASAYLSVSSSGILTYSSIILAFAIIPILELLTKGNGGNTAKEHVATRSQEWFFDLLLYLNLPIIYGLIYYYLYTISTQSLAVFELIGMTLGVGIFVGATGINVAHELGHRRSTVDKFLSTCLLITAYYQHFRIEHNRGHHRYVATPYDPATALLGESLYQFWVRSILGGLLSAWNIEKDRLHKLGVSHSNIQNQMIQFLIFQIAYMTVIYLLFDWKGLLFSIIIAIIAFLQLESINYIEHYGLLRRRRSSGQFEKVGMQHSWNSNHDLGRIFLYELTRHADHHYKASKKYQVLDHIEESPQLPTGYPGSILLALIPPLWFRHMDKRVPAEMKMMTKW